MKFADNPLTATFPFLQTFQPLNKARTPATAETTAAANPAVFIPLGLPLEKFGDSDVIVMVFL
jgi:hypothetical protein